MYNGTYGRKLERLAGSDLVALVDYGPAHYVTSTEVVTAANLWQWVAWGQEAGEMLDAGTQVPGLE